MEFKVINNINEIDKNQWSDFVYRHPNGNIFQTPEMYEVYNDSADTKPILNCIVENNSVCALYLGEILYENYDFSKTLTKRTVYYSEPLANNKFHFECLIKSAIRNSKGLFIEIRPRIEIDNKILISNGFKRRDHLNSMVYLTSLDENWKNLERDKRKGIRRAQNRYHLKIVEDNSYKSVEKNYKLLKNLYKKRKHPLRSKSYFHAIRRYLCDKGYAKFFLAYFADEIIAFQLALFYKTEILTYYTATSEKHKNKYAGDLLIWYLIEYGIQNGYQTLNFGGGGNPNRKYGPREYKKRFGTRFSNIGRYRYTKSMIFHIIEKVVPFWL